LEEAFQEAVVAVYSEIERGDEIERLRARLAVLTRNKAVDLGRRRCAQQDSARRAYASAGSAQARDVADAAVDDLTDAELARELERLVPARRAAVVGRVLGDLSFAELGRRLGVSEAAAKQRVRDGLHELRRRLLGRYGRDFCSAGRALGGYESGSFVDLDGRGRLAEAHLKACPQCRAAHRWVVAIDRALEGVVLPPGVAAGLQQGAEPERRLVRVRAMLAAFRHDQGLRGRLAELTTRGTPGGRTGEAVGAAGGAAAAGSATGGLTAAKLAAACAGISLVGGACFGVSELEGSAPPPWRAPDTARAMRAASEVIARAASSAAPNVATGVTQRPAATVGSLRPLASSVGAAKGRARGGSSATAGTPAQRAAARAGRQPAQRELGIESGGSGPPSATGASGGASPSTDAGIEP
jgi:DNA-directed RNA polymerase specialized sigma24 family protein